MYTYIHIYIYRERERVDSEKLEHGCRMIHADFGSYCTVGLEDGHVPTFWLLLYIHMTICLDRCMPQEWDSRSPPESPVPPSAAEPRSRDLEPGKSQRLGSSKGRSPLSASSAGSFKGDIDTYIYIYRYEDR